jgi:hypothetical protein
MPCRKGSTNPEESRSAPSPSHATRGRFVEICARATSGHVAAPPSRVMNLRRFIRQPLAGRLLWAMPGSFRPIPRIAHLATAGPAALRDFGPANDRSGSFSSDRPAPDALGMSASLRSRPNCRTAANRRSVPRGDITRCSKPTGSRNQRVGRRSFRQRSATHCKCHTGEALAKSFGQTVTNSFLRHCTMIGTKSELSPVWSN